MEGAFGEDVIKDVLCDQIAQLVRVADTHRFSTLHYTLAKTPSTKANNNKKAHPDIGQARNEMNRPGFRS